MKLGYARVSTSEQVLDLPLDALRQAGCEQGGRPPGLAPRYQQIASAVKGLSETGRQSTRQFMAYFQIGSRRTLYRILRSAGCQITPIRAAGPAQPARA